MELELGEELGEGPAKEHKYLLPISRKWAQFFVLFFNFLSLIFTSVALGAKGDAAVNVASRAARMEGRKVLLWLKLTERPVHAVRRAAQLVVFNGLCE